MRGPAKTGALRSRSGNASMTIDLFLLCVVLLAALLGAMTGAAKQIANVIALLIAYVAARPLGTWLGPMAAPELKAPTAIGIVAATFVAFIVVLVIARVAVAALVGRLFAGQNPNSRAVDRSLGFIFGGAKVGVLIWVILCALTFVEDNVTIAGRRIGVTPRTSEAFALARGYNLFELTQFSAVRDLIAVANASADPRKVEKLKNDAAWQRLKRDPRLKRVLSDKRLRDAYAQGDYRSLLRNNDVLQLIQDPELSDELRAAAASAKAL